MTETTTERVLYRGRVQGVGFRFSVRRIATKHPVTGYVKNLPDGSVELVAQGAPPAINRLLAEVAQFFHGHIADCARVPAETAEVFTEFDIRF